MHQGPMKVPQMRKPHNRYKGMQSFDIILDFTDLQDLFSFGILKTGPSWTLKSLSLQPYYLSWDGDLRPCFVILSILGKKFHYIDDIMLT